MSPHNLIGANSADVANASLDRSIVRRVVELARPYRGMLIGFLLTIIGAALVNLAPPLLIARIIEDAIPDEDLGLVNVLGALMILAAVADAGLSLLERRWSSKIGEGLIFDLRAALFDHVQRMPQAFFTSTQTGKLISRLNNDVIGAQRAMTGTLGSVVSNLIIVVTTVTAMVLIEWRLAILSLALLPLFIYPAKRVGRTLQSITREGMDLNASMNATMTERFNVAGALLVKLYGRHDTEANEFSEQAGRVRDIGIRSAVYSRTFFVALTLVGAIGTAAVYWIGARLVINGDLQLGRLVAMGYFVVRIYNPLTALTNARVDVMTALVSFERVFEVLDAPNPIVDGAGATHLEAPTGRIAFDDVTFAYPTPESASIASLDDRPSAPAGHGHGDGHGKGAHGHGSTGNGAGPADASDAIAAERTVLHNISLVVEPGTTTALVGPSGAGKSTIASLVPRLFDATQGAVTIDGVNVAELTLDSLRQAVGVVSQDPHLFHDTVRANLAYARPEATAADIEAACRAAHIHDVVANLPDGYDTIVGERGYRLSGGEKQRLAIARMLLKDPVIVVLDEATSHLDSENEVLVQRALESALTNRTTLVIAHRLSTIVGAEQILVIDDGTIVQRGTHDSLMDTGGLYAELYTTLVRT